MSSPHDIERVRGPPGDSVGNSAAVYWPCPSLEETWGCWWWRCWADGDGDGDGNGDGDGDGDVENGDGDGDVVGLNREISFCRWSRLPDYLQAKRQQLSLPAPQRRSPGADYLIWIIVTKNNDSHKNGDDRDHDGGGS